MVASSTVSMSRVGSSAEPFEWLPALGRISRSLRQKSIVRVRISGDCGVRQLGGLATHSLFRMGSFADLGVWAQVVARSGFGLASVSDTAKQRSHLSPSATRQRPDSTTKHRKRLTLSHRTVAASAYARSSSVDEEPDRETTPVTHCDAAYHASASAIFRRASLTSTTKPFKSSMSSA